MAMQVPAYSEIFHCASRHKGAHQAQTKNPKIPIDNIAYTIPRYDDWTISLSIFLRVVFSATTIIVSFIY